MRRPLSICLLFFLTFTACVPKRSINEAMLNFLPYLNQKVEGYVDENKLTLNDENYKAIVEKVCFPLPSCKKSAKTMFDTYTIYSRPLDGMFSVMLCDKKNNLKDMEDFSCDVHIVEMPTFQKDKHELCTFEQDWITIIRPYCPAFIH